MTERTCIGCRWWDFSAGERGYSEMTPGSGWSSECMKWHWSHSGPDVSQDEFRASLMSATTCPDFAARGEARS